MESCCILGCDSYREAATKSIGYFKFPLNNGILLYKWLQQINRQDWNPSEHSQICSAHFKTEDLKYQQYRKQPVLKPNAVPTLFPTVEKKAMVKETKPKQQQNQKQPVVDSRAIILRRQPATMPIKELCSDVQDEAKQWLNPQSILIRPNLTKQSTSKTEPTIQLIPVTQTRLQMMLPKTNSALLSNSSSVSTPILHRKKALLRITVHKEYHKVASPTHEEHFETVYLPNYSDNEMDVETVKFKSDSLQPRQDVCDSKKESLTGNSSSVDPKIHKLPRIKDELAVTSEQVPASQTKDVPVPEAAFADVGDVIRDHVYSFPSALQLQYSYSKAQIDCDKLRKRLKMLRLQHKREQEKVKKLQCHLADLGNKIKKNFNADCVKSKSKSRTKLGNCEDEYEKLLREVRKLKKNLVVHNTNFVEPRSVSPHKTTGYKDENEKVAEVVNEEHSLVRRNQETHDMMNEVNDDGEIIGEIEEDCGEIIGEIDDNSIEMDLGVETRSLDSNEEFLNPGLIEG